MTLLKQSISLFIIIAFLGAIWFLSNIFLTRGHSQEEIIFDIKEGSGLKQIALGLQEKGVIRSADAFSFLVLLQNKQAAMRQGSYQLSGDMNVYEIARQITTPGKAKKVAVFEGWNLNTIADFFEKEGRFSKADFFAVSGQPGSTENSPENFCLKFPFLNEKPSELSLEGYLFPDSYEFYESDGPEEIIKKMLFRFSQKITADLQAKAAQQGKTFFEILIMASLLEKEVKTYKDKRMVAGILWKRLKNNWPLQVDATLVYISGENALNSHKEIDSSYNTYKNKGLPPGPICNPGIESIEAALNPEESPYWYYISAAGGQTIFSRTLDEHNINRARYLN